MFFNAPVHALLICISTKLALSKLFNNNPDGGIVLDSPKISTSFLLYYDRCSELNSCY